MKSIAKNNVHIHNFDTFTHIDTHHKTKSNIDLVLSTPNFTEKIITEVEDDSHGSDHFPISLNVNVEKKFYQKKTFSIKSVRTDWISFKDELEKDYVRFLTENYELLSPSQKYDFFIEVVTEAVKKSTPRKKNCSNNKTQKTPYRGGTKIVTRSNVLEKHAIKNGNTHLN